MKKPIARTIKSNIDAGRDDAANLPDLAKPPAMTAEDIPDHAVGSFFEDIYWSILDVDSPYGRAKAEVAQVEKLLADKKAVLKFEADKLRAAIGAIKSPDVAKVFDAQIYDDYLRECLSQMQPYSSGYVGNTYKQKIPVKGVTPWPDLIKSGATDAQIDSNLRNGFGPIGSYWSSGWKIGRVGKLTLFIHRDGNDRDEKVVEPDMLVDEVRRVLSIPQPKPVTKPAAKPAPKPAAKKPSTKSPQAKPEERAAQKAETKSKPAAKPKPAAAAKSSAAITNVRLSLTPNGGYAVKYRKGTHSKSFLIGASDPGTAKIETAKALGIDVEQVTYEGSAEVKVKNEEPNEAPSNDDQSPVDPASDGAADLSSDAVTVDLSGEERIFLTNGRWRLWCSDQKLDDPCTEAILLDATTQDEAIKEAAAFMGVPADKIVLIDAPAQAEVSS